MLGVVVKRTVLQLYAKREWGKGVSIPDANFLAGKLPRLLLSQRRRPATDDRAATAANAAPQVGTGGVAGRAENWEGLHSRQSGPRLLRQLRRGVGQSAGECGPGCGWGGPHRGSGGALDKGCPALPSIQAGPGFAAVAA